jgi:hypothetical protein
VVSPATTSVLRFVPRSENLKNVRKVSISPLPIQHACFAGLSDALWQPLPRSEALKTSVPGRIVG